MIHLRGTVTLLYLAPMISCRRIVACPSLVCFPLLPLSNLKNEESQLSPFSLPCHPISPCPRLSKPARASPVIKNIITLMNDSEARSTISKGSKTNGLHFEEKPLLLAKVVLQLNLRCPVRIECVVDRLKLSMNSVSHVMEPPFVLLLSISSIESFLPAWRKQHRMDQTQSRYRNPSTLWNALTHSFLGSTLPEVNSAHPTQNKEKASTIWEERGEVIPGSLHFSHTHTSSEYSWVNHPFMFPRLFLPCWHLTHTHTFTV